MFVLLERKDGNKRRGAEGWNKSGWDILTMKEMEMERWVMETVVVRWIEIEQGRLGGGSLCPCSFKLLGSLLLIRAENSPQSPQILLSWVTWDRLLCNSVWQISHSGTDTDAPFFFRRDKWQNSISVPMSRFRWLKESLMILTKRPQKGLHQAPERVPTLRIEAF